MRPVPDGRPMGRMTSEIATPIHPLQIYGFLYDLPIGNLIRVSWRASAMLSPACAVSGTAGRRNPIRASECVRPANGQITPPLRGVVEAEPAPEPAP